VKQFAREHPGMFLLGAFSIGIVAGRTLRNADTHALAEAAKPNTAQSPDSSSARQAFPGEPTMPFGTAPDVAVP
jgi:hypothetical protein